MEQNQPSNKPDEAPKPPATRRKHFSYFGPDTWAPLMAKVEAGKSWIEAAQSIHPTVPKEMLLRQLNRLRWEHKAFKKFLERRGSTFGALKEKDVLTMLADISSFNLADLYQQAPDGTVSLSKDWLKKAKEKNVLCRIVIKTFNKLDKDGNVEGIHQFIDIQPYSRIQSIDKFCKMKGFYGDTSVNKEKQNITNNMLFVTQANKIRNQIMESVKEGKVPEGALPPIDKKLLDQMIDVEIVRDEKNGDGVEDD